MNNLDLIKIGSDCVARVNGLGFEMHQVSNTVTAMNGMESIRDYPVSRPLSSRMHDFTETNSFWLFLTKDGAKVGGVCAHQADIGTEPIATWWSRTLTRQFFPDGGGTVTAQDLPEVTRIKGNIVYLGDLYLIEEHRGSKHLLLAIMHMLFVLTASKWPDLNWVYSFLRNSDMGKAQFYGFTDIIPTVLDWPEYRFGRSNDEHIAAIPRERLAHVLKHQSQVLKVDSAN